jgi:hypothetical protein
MKSFIIFVLFVALLAAAYFTRPSQADFGRYITDQKATGQTNLLKAGWAQFQTDQFAQSCTFNDRLLWVNVQRNGKTVYTGAFGHWFNRATVAGDVNAARQKVESVQLGGK